MKNFIGMSNSISKLKIYINIFKVFNSVGSIMNSFISNPKHDVPEFTVSSFNLYFLFRSVLKIILLFYTI